MLMIFSFAKIFLFFVHWSTEQNGDYVEKKFVTLTAFRINNAILQDVFIVHNIKDLLNSCWDKALRHFLLNSLKVN